MTALEVADLVVIAGRALGISTDAALAQMDIAVARDAPRLTPVRRARQQRAAPGASRGLPASVPVARVPVRRAVAGALLVAAVTGAALVSAACSRGPAVPAVPAGGVTVCSSACGGAAPSP